VTLRCADLRSLRLVSGAVPPSSAQASTIRARSASDYDAFRLRASASSEARSASESSSGATFGLGMSQACDLQRYF
jgi:nucleoside diphosphate kinase